MSGNVQNWYYNRTLAGWTTKKIMGFDPTKKEHGASTATGPTGPGTTEGDFGAEEAAKAEERKRIAAQKAQILSGTTNTNSVNTGAI